MTDQTQHDRDSAALRQLCQERDSLRSQLAAANLRIENHARLIKGYQDELRRLQAMVDVMTPHADRAGFMLTHWKSAQVRCHTSGPNIRKPKGATVVFDFTRLADPSALMSVIDEARSVQEGGA